MGKEGNSSVIFIIFAVYSRHNVDQYWLEKDSETTTGTMVLVINREKRESVLEAMLSGRRFLRHFYASECSFAKLYVRYSFL